MTELEVVQDQIETSVEMLFQRWKINLFGPGNWPNELNEADAKLKIKMFLLKAAQLSKYGITHPLADAD